MDIYTTPGSTLLILLAAIVISTFYARYNSRDVRMRYAMITMKEKMNELKKYQKRFKETQDERYLQKMNRIQNDLLELQRQVYMYQMTRMVASMAVFFTLYYVLSLIYGRSPVAYAPFRIPRDIRSVPVEYNGRIISGLTFIGRYFLSSLTLSLVTQMILDKVNRNNLKKGLKRLFSRVFL